MRILRFQNAENGTRAANDPQRFRNRRAELFWNLRERLEKGEISFPRDDQEIIPDLSAIRFEFDQAGKIKLESKDETRKRLGRSPDRADALVLAFDATETIDWESVNEIMEINARLVTPNPWDYVPEGDVFSQ